MITWMRLVAALLASVTAMFHWDTFRICREVPQIPSCGSSERSLTIAIVWTALAGVMWWSVIRSAE